MAEDWGLTPCQTAIDLASKEYARLELTNSQRSQVEALLNQLPAIAATSAASTTTLYSLKFPEGLPDTLMKLRNGEGYTTTLIGADKKIVGTAALREVSSQAVVLGIFTVMAIASGQYFLKGIHDEMSMMRMDLDKILGFLYGDKKAELVSELNFTRYAYWNYSSIMQNESQRAAVVSGLHEAKRIAMKDIEFYIGDLSEIVSSKSEKDMALLAKKAIQSKESIDLSMQLYGMSGLLEIYFSENYAPTYIDYVKRDVFTYIDKCEKRLLGSFAELKGMSDKNGFLFKKTDPTAAGQISEITDALKNGEASGLKASLQTAFDNVSRKSEYIVKDNGEVYLKLA